MKIQFVSKTAFEIIMLQCYITGHISGNAPYK